MANFNYHQIKCIAKLSIFGTLHLMLPRGMFTVFRGSLIGVLLQKEPPGRIQGIWALAAWGPHLPALLVWEAVK